MSPYYNRSDLKRIPDLVKLAPQASSSFFAFEQQVYRDEGALSAKTKELIAIAVAHVTGCPYCIDTHVQRFQAIGGTREEMLEAVLVAASTRAGGVLGHAVMALNAFDNSSSEAGDQSPPAHSDPSCFC